MLMPMIVGVTALLTLTPSDTDTTFSVPAGARIEIHNYAGEVVVRTWDRDAVRVTADRSGTDRVAVQVTGSVVRIESPRRRGAARTIDYQITVPANSALRITGPYNDVTVNGAGGDVSVETIRGDVRVTGGNGVISLRSVEGSLHLERARGKISVNAVNDDIRIRDASGDIRVETVNGDVRLERIQSEHVDASTINGDVAYDGIIRDGGRYALTTHNGDVRFTIPEGANATVSIVTFNGELDLAFPIELTETRAGRRYHFTVGNGSARVDLESFNGTVRLRRPEVARKSAGGT